MDQLRKSGRYLVTMAPPGSEQMLIFLTQEQNLLKHSNFYFLLRLLAALPSLLLMILSWWKVAAARYQLDCKNKIWVIFMKEPIPGILLHCSFESDDICGYTTHDMSGDATVFEQRRGDPLTADHTTHTALGKIKTAIQADYFLFFIHCFHYLFLFSSIFHSNNCTTNHLFQYLA